MNNYLGVHGLPSIFIPHPATTIQSMSQHGKHNNTDEKDQWGGNISIGYMGDQGGCGWWRMQLPELIINYSKLGNLMGLNKLIPDPNFYTDVKSVRLQRQATPEHLKFMKHLKEISSKNRMKLIYEIDDVILRDDIPDFNVAKDAYKDEKILEATKEMMGICDTMTTTCDYLRDYFTDKIGHKDIRVIPNMAPRMWFDGMYNSTKLMTALEKNQKRPRILYAGSGNHFNINRLKGVNDDFSHVVNTILKTKKQFKWVFMGAFPYELKPYIDNGEIEFHNWAMIMNYPRAIYDLDVNAVVAPLMDCTFNRSKSNIKYLESAYLGIPGVFQDMVTYKDAPIRFNTGDEMIDQLKNLLTNRQYYAKMSKSARNYANTMWLDDHMEMYSKLLF
jgi:hypothetical protein